MDYCEATLYDKSLDCGCLDSLYGSLSRVLIP
jgi:hypothetical protein